MQSADEMSFADMIEYYLGDRVSDSYAGAVELNNSSPEFRQFIARMLDLMRVSGSMVTDLTPFHLLELPNIIKNILPNAWGGMIPPLTFAGRHRKLDDYVASHSFEEDSQKKVFVDLGCGLPPVTTVDTAKRLPDWKIVGIDRTFAHYVVYHPDDHYACFDHQGQFQYFQPVFGTLTAREFYANPQAAREHFIDAYKMLHPQLPKNEMTGSDTVEKDGYRLIRNLFRDFESPNLTLLEAEIGEESLPPATVVRCMNVLVYFPADERRRLMALIGADLRRGGVMLWGTNGMTGLASRYGVAVREGDVLVPSQFALSLDSLLPIGVMPYFTLHAEDPEATFLAELRNTLRGDSRFWPDFSRRVDELLAVHGLSRRGEDGFLEFPTERISPMKYTAKMSALWEQVMTDGFKERAIEALCCGGFKAFVNHVGDIAIKPVERPLFEKIPVWQEG